MRKGGYLLRCILPQSEPGRKLKVQNVKPHLPLKEVTCGCITRGSPPTSIPHSGRSQILFINFLFAEAGTTSQKFYPHLAVYYPGDIELDCLFVSCCFTPQRQYFSYVMAVIWYMSWEGQSSTLDFYRLERSLTFDTIWEKLAFDNVVSHTR